MLKFVHVDSNGKNDRWLIEILPTGFRANGYVQLFSILMGVLISLQSLCL
jgi:hypothetical protein